MRKAGILLHPTSLPGKYRVGTLGKECKKFIDFLEKSKQSLWQVFPLGPTGYGDSPYQCFSAFAGNPYLIDLENLVELGLLSEEDIKVCYSEDDNYVDYGKLYEIKNPLLEKAYDKHELLNDEFVEFKKENSSWLDNYTLFISIKNYNQGASWDVWDKDIKFREPKAIEKYEKLLAEQIDKQKFIQFLFFKQWKEIKKYANSKNIQIIGDIPIFVAFDSADAWANTDIFLFDNDLKPCCVAGVPPDYFSATGQLWGNPLYNWDKMRETGYKWWIERIGANLSVCDIIRIDHFRGFESYWEIPYGEQTAINGKWVKGPGIDFFNKLKETFGELNIIAEDLGILTDEVVKLKESAGLPGMKILQFAFDGDMTNDYLPHNFEQNCVVYTGTHDNDTTQGWYNSLNDEERNRVKSYINNWDDAGIVWNLIRLTHNSIAKFSIIPMQDYLCLDSRARINTPGVSSGNWMFRIKENAMSDELANSIADLTKNSGR
nr:4-alpha-glucanotransferase [Caviibacter abscessus]